MRRALAFVAALAATSGCGVESGRAAHSGSALNGPIVAADSLRVRRVWSGEAPNFYAAEPSPDGTMLSEIDWDTGDLAVRDLATGSLRRVTDKGTWGVSTDYAEFSVWSPDGQRLAYSWFSEKGRGYQLRIIGVDGAGERVLVQSHPDLQYIAAEHWSPDGRTILATIFRADRSSQIATVSVEDGSIRVLKTSEWRHPFIAAFSPDSRYIAYDFLPDEKATQRDIFIMPVDGSREVRLVGGASQDVLLGWLPDGGSILFYSDRGQTKGIWRQKVSDGQPVGEPELVRPDLWQLFPLGFSRNAYYFGVNTETPQVHTATVDLAARRTVVQPAAVQPPSGGVSGFGAWSADGRFLAYSRQVPDARTAAIVIRPVSGEEAREIRLRIDRPRFLQWMPDNEHLTFFGQDDKGREGVFRMNVRTGEHALVALREPSPSNGMGFYRISPNGRTLLYRIGEEPADGRTGTARHGTLVSRDLESGVERELYRLRGIGPVFFSPDGQWFAAREIESSALRRIVVGRTDGTGELRTLFETARPLPQNRGGFEWTPDGRHVLVPVGFQGERKSEILMIPVEGGEPTAILEWHGDILDLRLSPDGRRLSFTSGRPRGEVWRIENLPTSDTPVIVQARGR
jgi:Tol biopolymer transport system component